VKIVQLPTAKAQITENITKKMQKNDSNPNFMPELKEKFQTKIFVKLQELDPALPWVDSNEIPLNFVCDFESGKKFEAKCPYCTSSPVVYYRYQQAGDAFYPKLNDSNYFKHVTRHLGGGVGVGNRGGGVVSIF
jgi:hypothetical protein